MVNQSPNTNPLAQARAFADAGQIGPARKAYNDALKSSPHDSELLQEAGFMEIEAGDLASAARYMAQAVELTPNSADAQMNLGEIHRLLGNKAEALLHFDKVIELTPQDGDAHHALAELHVGQGAWKKAKEHITLARQLVPDEPEILNLYGIISENLGKIEDARTAFLRAIEIAPGFTDPLCNMGALCLQTNHYEEAIQHYQAAAKHITLTDAQLTNLYNCYIVLDMAEMALQVAEQLTLSSGSNKASLVARGSAHRALGNFDAAERDYRAALQEDMSFAPAYENLGVIHKLTPRDLDHINKRLNQSSSLSDEVRVGYFYALYYGHRDEKEYALAFDYLKQANQIVLDNSNFDKTQIPTSTDRTIRIFDKSFFANNEGHGYAEPGAIFIVGMPRSGTTLTERILAAHPKIHGGGERNSLPNLLDRTENYHDVIASVTTEWSKAKGKRIHESMFSKAGDAAFVTDKMPGNFNNIGLIHRLLPNAKIIFCKRNAMDNCLSCFEQHFTSGLHFTASLEGLGDAYRHHLRVMEHWFQTCPIPIHTVVYEDLVSDPEPQVRAMLDYIGVDWDPRCLEPEKTEHSIATASVWQARQPINTGSIERWRRFEEQLQPLAEMVEGM